MDVTSTMKSWTEQQELNPEWNSTDATPPSFTLHRLQMGRKEHRYNCKSTKFRCTHWPTVNQLPFVLQSTSICSKSPVIARCPNLIADMKPYSDLVFGDVQVPNFIDDLDELLNTPWDGDAMLQCNMDALYDELNQASMLTPVASPAEGHVGSEVITKKEDCEFQNKPDDRSAMLTPHSSPQVNSDIISGANAQPCSSSTLQQGGFHQSDQFAVDRLSNNFNTETISHKPQLTSVAPQSSPQVKSEIINGTNVQPCTLQNGGFQHNDHFGMERLSNNFNTENRSQDQVTTGYVDQQLLDAVNHLKKIANITTDFPIFDDIYKKETTGNTRLHASCVNIGNQIKAEPLYELNPPYQANVKKAPLRVRYQTPKEVFLAQTSFSPTTFIPSYTQYSVSSPKSSPDDYLFQSQVDKENEMPIFTLAEQQMHGLSTDSSHALPTADTCCDSPLADPKMTCTEYLSSVKFDSDTPESPEPPAAYYVFVPESQTLVKSEQSQQDTIAQVKTVVPKEEPIVETIVPSADYVQIQNNYVVPLDGTVRTYPVKEIYRIDREETTPAEQPAQRKKPRKANINYGTEFYCKICCKEFGKRGSFQQHWRQKHEENRPFRCDTCGKTYLTERDLRVHKQNHDPNMKQWKCSECNNRYRHMKDRDRHYDTHHGTPAHACVIEGCEKAFARRDHMLAHLISHDNRTMRELKKAQVREEKEQIRRQRGRKHKMVLEI
ncbi:uncharacterized protein LOC134219806 isoform X2 [Armigeres subalbatus]|uniref:uncharacterized protein LOC134219806 isoform X2 n=1 Tax=Armigeres subalbatus TaxID=124917 RepID=UPI002ED4DB70